MKKIVLCLFMIGFCYHVHKIAYAQDQSWNNYINNSNYNSVYNSKGHWNNIDPMYSPSTLNKLGQSNTGYDGIESRGRSFYNNSSYGVKDSNYSYGSTNTGFDTNDEIKCPSWRLREDGTCCWDCR